MAIQKYNKEVMSHKTSHYAIYYIPPPLVGCMKNKKHKHTYLNNAYVMNIHNDSHIKHVQLVLGSNHSLGFQIRCG